MSAVAVGIGAGVAGIGSIVGGVLGAGGARAAARTQADAIALGVEEQRLAREELRELLAPFLQAGESALPQFLSFVGLGDDPASEQQRILSEIEQGPQFQLAEQRAQEAINQAAGASGGIGGARQVGLLARLRPELTNQLLDQRFNRLSGLVNLGQRSAAGVGAGGLQSAGNISSLLAQQGGALAQGQLLQSKILSDAIGGGLGAIGRTGVQLGTLDALERSAGRGGLFS